jgi:hypothetical protein
VIQQDPHVSNSVCSGAATLVTHIESSNGRVGATEIDGIRPTRARALLVHRKAIWRCDTWVVVKLGATALGNAFYWLLEVYDCQIVKPGWLTAARLRYY